MIEGYSPQDWTTAVRQQEAALTAQVGHAVVIDHDEFTAAVLAMPPKERYTILHPVAGVVPPIQFFPLSLAANPAINLANELAQALQHQPLAIRNAVANLDGTTPNAGRDFHIWLQSLKREERENLYLAAPPIAAVQFDPMTRNNYAQAFLDHLTALGRTIPLGHAPHLDATLNADWDAFREWLGRRSQTERDLIRTTSPLTPAIPRFSTRNDYAPNFDTHLRVSGMRIGSYPPPINSPLNDHNWHILRDWVETLPPQQQEIVRTATPAEITRGVTTGAAPQQIPKVDLIDLIDHGVPNPVQIAIPLDTYRQAFNAQLEALGRPANAVPPGTNPNTHADWPQFYNWYRALPPADRDRVRGATTLAAINAPAAGPAQIPRFDPLDPPDYHQAFNAHLEALGRGANAVPPGTNPNTHADWPGFLVLLRGATQPQRDAIRTTITVAALQAPPAPGAAPILRYDPLDPNDYRGAFNAQLEALGYPANAIALGVNPNTHAHWPGFLAVLQAATQEQRDAMRVATAAALQAPGNQIPRFDPLDPFHYRQAFNAQLEALGRGANTIPNDGTNPNTHADWPGFLAVLQAATQEQRDAMRVATAAALQAPGNQIPRFDPFDPFDYRQAFNAQLEALGRGPNTIAPGVNPNTHADWPTFAAWLGALSQADKDAVRNATTLNAIRTTTPRVSRFNPVVQADYLQAIQRQETHLGLGLGTIQWADFQPWVASLSEADRLRVQSVNPAGDQTLPRFISRVAHGPGFVANMIRLGRVPGAPALAPDPMNNALDANWNVYSAWLRTLTPRQQDNVRTQAANAPEFDPIDAQEYGQAFDHHLTAQGLAAAGPGGAAAHAEWPAFQAWARSLSDADKNRVRGGNPATDPTLPRYISRVAFANAFITEMQAQHRMPRPPAAPDPADPRYDRDWAEFSAWVGKQSPANQNAIRTATNPPPYELQPPSYIDAFVEHVRRALQPPAPLGGGAAPAVPVLAAPVPRALPDPNNPVPGTHYPTVQARDAAYVAEVQARNTAAENFVHQYRDLWQGFTDLFEQNRNQAEQDAFNPAVVNNPATPALVSRREFAHAFFAYQESLGRDVLPGVRQEFANTNLDSLQHIRTHYPNLYADWQEFSGAVAVLPLPERNRVRDIERPVSVIAPLPIFFDPYIHADAYEPVIKKGDYSKAFEDAVAHARTEGVTLQWEVYAHWLLSLTPETKRQKLSNTEYKTVAERAAIDGAAAANNANFGYPMAPVARIPAPEQFPARYTPPLVDPDQIQIAPPPKNLNPANYTHAFADAAAKVKRLDRYAKDLTMAEYLFWVNEQDAKVQRALRDGTYRPDANEPTAAELNQAIRNENAARAAEAPIRAAMTPAEETLFAQWLGRLYGTERANAISVPAAPLTHPAGLPRFEEITRARYANAFNDHLRSVGYPVPTPTAAADPNAHNAANVEWDRFKEWLEHLSQAARDDVRGRATVVAPLAGTPAAWMQAVRDQDEQYALAGRPVYMGNIQRAGQAADKLEFPINYKAPSDTAPIAAYPPAIAPRSRTMRFVGWIGRQISPSTYAYGLLPYWWDRSYSGAPRVELNAAKGDRLRGARRQYVTTNFTDEKRDLPYGKLPLDLQPMVRTKRNLKFRYRDPTTGAIRPRLRMEIDPTKLNLEGRKELKAASRATIAEYFRPQRTARVVWFPAAQRIARRIRKHQAARIANTPLTPILPARRDPTKAIGDLTEFEHRFDQLFPNPHPPGSLAALNYPLQRDVLLLALKDLIPPKTLERDTRPPFEYPLLMAEALYLATYRPAVAGVGGAPGTPGSADITRAQTALDNIQNGALDLANAEDVTTIRVHRAGPPMNFANAAAQREAHVDSWRTAQILSKSRSGLDTLFRIDRTHLPPNPAAADADLILKTKKEALGVYVKALDQLFERRRALPPAADVIHPSELVHRSNVENNYPRISRFRRTPFRPSRNPNDFQLGSISAARKLWANPLAYDKKTPNLNANDALTDDEVKAYFFGAKNNYANQGFEDAYDLTKNYLHKSLTTHLDRAVEKDNQRQYKWYNPKRVAHIPRWLNRSAGRNKSSWFALKKGMSGAHLKYRSEKEEEVDNLLRPTIRNSADIFRQRLLGRTLPGDSVNDQQAMLGLANLNDLVANARNLAMLEEWEWQISEKNPAKVRPEAVVFDPAALQRIKTRALAIIDEVANTHALTPKVINNPEDPNDPGYTLDPVDAGAPGAAARARLHQDGGGQPTAMASDILTACEQAKTTLAGLAADVELINPNRSFTQKTLKGTFERFRKQKGTYAFLSGFLTDNKLLDVKFPPEYLETKWIRKETDREPVAEHTIRTHLVRALLVKEGDFLRPEDFNPESLKTLFRDYFSRVPMGDRWRGTDGGKMGINNTEGILALLGWLVSPAVEITRDKSAGLTINTAGHAAEISFLKQIDYQIRLGAYGGVANPIGALLDKAAKVLGVGGSLGIGGTATVGAQYTELKGILMRYARELDDGLTKQREVTKQDGTTYTKDDWRVGITEMMEFLLDMAQQAKDAKNDPTKKALTPDEMMVAYARRFFPERDKVSIGWQDQRNLVLKTNVSVTGSARLTFVNRESEAGADGQPHTVHHRGDGFKPLGVSVSLGAEIDGHVVQARVESLGNMQRKVVQLGHVSFMTAAFNVGMVFPSQPTNDTNYDTLNHPPLRYGSMSTSFATRGVLTSLRLVEKDGELIDKFSYLDVEFESFDAFKAGIENNRAIWDAAIGAENVPKYIENARKRFTGNQKLTERYRARPEAIKILQAYKAMASMDEAAALAAGDVAHKKFQENQAKTLAELAVALVSVPNMWDTLGYYDYKFLKEKDDNNFSLGLQADAHTDVSAEWETDWIGLSTQQIDMANKVRQGYEVNVPWNYWEKTRTLIDQQLGRPSASLNPPQPVAPAVAPIAPVDDSLQNVFGDIAHYDAPDDAVEHEVEPEDHHEELLDEEEHIAAFKAKEPVKPKVAIEVEDKATPEVEHEILVSLDHLLPSQKSSLQAVLNQANTALDAAGFRKIEITSSKDGSTLIASAVHSDGRRLTASLPNKPTEDNREYRALVGVFINSHRSELAKLAVSRNQEIIGAANTALGALGYGKIEITTSKDGLTLTASVTHSDGRKLTTSLPNMPTDNRLHQRLVGTLKLDAEIIDRANTALKAAGFGKVEITTSKDGSTLTASATHSDGRKLTTSLPNQPTDSHQYQMLVGTFIDSLQIDQANKALEAAGYGKVELTSSKDGLTLIASATHNDGRKLTTSLPNEGAENRQQMLVGKFIDDLKSELAELAVKRDAGPVVEHEAGIPLASATIADSTERKAFELARHEANQTLAKSGFGEVKVTISKDGLTLTATSTHNDGRQLIHSSTIESGQKHQHDAFVEDFLHSHLPELLTPSLPSYGAASSVSTTAPKDPPKYADINKPANMPAQDPDKLPQYSDVVDPELVKAFVAKQEKAFAAAQQGHPQDIKEPITAMPDMRHKNDESMALLNRLSPDLRSKVVEHIDQQSNPQWELRQQVQPVAQTDTDVKKADTAVKKKPALKAASKQPTKKLAAPSPTETSGLQGATVIGVDQVTKDRVVAVMSADSKTLQLRVVDNKLAQKLGLPDQGKITIDKKRANAQEKDPVKEKIDAHKNANARPASNGVKGRSRP